MNKKLIIAAAVLVSGLLYASSGYCMWCPGYTCYSSSSCGQCLCIVEPGQIGGRCVGVAP